MKEDQVENLTDHLNNTDPSGSIKFTDEKETSDQIPFLDTLIVRKPDGSVKLLVYMKTTHTDQYLNFASHHPLNHKLGVVRMLLDRMDRIVTEDVDKQKEEATIKKALGTATIRGLSIKWKKKMQNKKQKAPIKNKDSSQKSRGMVVLPYVQGLAERASRVFKKYHISTAMKPHSSLRKQLVNPKDKIDPLEKNRLYLWDSL